MNTGHRIDSEVDLLILLERIGAHIVSYLAFWNGVELTLLLRIEFWNLSQERNLREDMTTQNL